MTAQLILADSGTWSWVAYSWGDWAWLIVPLAIYAVVSLALFGFGRTDEPNLIKFFFRQIADSLQRATGYPGWSMAGVLSGLLFLLILVIGFYWDVAWHVDNGRDVLLFTPPHVMILVGLAGLVYGAVLTVLFASLEQADVGLAVGRIRIPWSAVLLLSLGAGGIVAFPLDNLWHQAYGIDVTLWSPPHLQLLAGGSLATIALWLMCAEAGASARPNALGRGITVLTAGTVLVALSTFQAEFDFGVPQFQVLYLPLLIMAAAGLALVAARIALGPWGAVKIALVYLLLRALLAAVVGGALGHTVPRFALYLPSALAVEAAARTLGTSRRLRLAFAAGALIGTLGLVGELAWVGLAGWSPPRMPLALLGKIAVLSPLAAVAAAVLGVGLARAFSHDGERMPVAALGLAVIALLGVLAYPLPRRVGQVEAVIRIVPVGDRATVEVQLDPPDAARDATAFAVTSWQGGGTVTALLDEVAPDRYRSSQAVPVTGSWKSVVSLQRGDQVMAAPVYLPADPEIGAPEVPAVPERRAAFVRNTSLLLREVHAGPAWPAVAAYAGLAALVTVWVALIAATARRVHLRAPSGPARPSAAPPAAPVLSRSVL